MKKLSIGCSAEAEYVWWARHFAVNTFYTLHAPSQQLCILYFSCTFALLHFLLIFSQLPLAGFQPDKRTL